MSPQLSLGGLLKDLLLHVYFSRVAVLWHAIAEPATLITASLFAMPNRLDFAFVALASVALGFFCLKNAASTRRKGLASASREEREEPERVQPVVEDKAKPDYFVEVITVSETTTKTTQFTRTVKVETSIKK